MITKEEVKQKILDYAKQHSKADNDSEASFYEEDAVSEILNYFIENKIHCTYLHDSLIKSVYFSSEDSAVLFNFKDSELNEERNVHPDVVELFNFFEDVFFIDSE